jgi:hypothetical protein
MGFVAWRMTEGAVGCQTTLSEGIFIVTHWREKARTATDAATT